MTVFNERIAANVCTLSQGKLTRVQGVAQHFGMPVVVFDIEHTGAGKGARGITDFAAISVSPQGAVTLVQSLVNPHSSCEFNPYATRITGLTAERLASAPSLPQVYSTCIPKDEALWLGYGSKSDLSVWREDLERHGLADDFLARHVDIRSLVPGMKGLGAQAQELLIDVPQGDLHRAAADAQLTLLVLEALLSSEKITAKSIYFSLKGQAQDKSAPPRERPRGHNGG